MCARSSSGTYCGVAHGAYQSGTRVHEQLTGKCSDLEPRWLTAMSRLVKRSIRVMRLRRGRPLFAVGSNDMNVSKVVESSQKAVGASTLKVLIEA